MDDGVELATDVYMPDGPGPHPAILVRIPYHRKGSDGQARRFVEHGFAYVVQDVRGKFDSDGVHEPLIDEARDGHSALDWLANQAWCDGRLGMWGRSYFGMTQIYAAPGGHEALRCIAPSIAPASYFTDWARYDGCFGWGNLIRWSLTHSTCRTQPTEGHFDWMELMALRTVEEVERATGLEASMLRTYLEHDTDDGYWAARDQLPLMPRIGVPGTHMAGWFDHVSRGQFQALDRIGRDYDPRPPQWLLVGPWGHISSLCTGEEHKRYGSWEFGDAADFDVLEDELRCLDHFVQDHDNGWDETPRVRLFVMGGHDGGRWESSAEWPPASTSPLTMHLAPGSELRSDCPSGSRADAFSYDPRDPAPNLGGAIYWGFDPVGPVDQRPIMSRADVVSYRSEPFARPTAVIGEIDLTLWIATDVEDTDIVAKFCVEEPSGSVTVLTNGSLRCRYRRSWSEPEPLTPGEATELIVDLGKTAYEFPAGSRVVLLITSSEFPRILPHVNRYVPSLEMASDGGPESVVARTEVLHGEGTPSRVVLSVVDS